MSKFSVGDRVVWVGREHDQRYLQATLYQRTGSVGDVSGPHIYVDFDEGGRRTCAADNLQRLRIDEDEQVFGG